MYGMEGKEGRGGRWLKKFKLAGKPQKVARRDLYTQHKAKEASIASTRNISRTWPPDWCPL